MIYKVEDIDLPEFVEKYALMITEKRTLQYALLICNGNTQTVSALLTFGERGLTHDRVEAEFELIRLGFLS